MEHYKNLNGNSNVDSYEIRNDEILVKFNSGMYYLYNSGKTGEININKMVGLAKQGYGLNSFINKYVKTRYAGKYKTNPW